MRSNLNKSTRVTGLIVVLLLLMLLIMPFYIGIYTFADAIRGFEIMQEYKAGAAFNTLNYPGINSPLVSYQVAWWAPAQWLIPFFIQMISGITDLQLLQQISVAFSLIFAIAGFYKIFQRLNIDPFVRNISLLLILTSPLFYWQSLMYFGGDLFTLAFFPWFVLFLISRNSKTKLTDAVLFLLLGIIGLYIKTSFLLLIASGGLFLFFREQQTLKDQFRSNWHFILSAIGVLVYAKLFLLTGETPGSAYDYEGWFGVPNTLSGDLLYSPGSPVGILTTLSMFLQKTEAQSMSGIVIILSKGVLVLLSLKVVFSTIWKDQKYGKLLLLFALPYLLFFIYFYLTDKAVSYEMRHFAPIAFLFFPAILNRFVYYFGKMSLIILAILLVTFNGLGYYENVKTLKTLPVRAGIKVSQEEAELADLLIDWDNNHSKSLFLMEEYWAPSFYIRKNDKIILKGRKNTIVSGIELDHTDNLDKIRNINTLVQHYNEVLIVGYRENSTNLFIFAEKGQLISSGDIGRYHWERINLLEHAKRSIGEK